MSTSRALGFNWLNVHTEIMYRKNKLQNITKTMLKAGVEEKLAAEDEIVAK